MKRVKPRKTRLKRMLILYVSVYDLTYRQLALEIGISKSALGRIMVNEGDLSATNMVKLMAWMLSIE